MNLRYAVALVLAATLHGDEPKVFKPTEIQSLRLQVKQKDAQLAQANLQVAQQQFKAALQGLTEEAERIKGENKWDDKVQFDPNSLSFSEPKAEVKKQ